MTPNTSLLPRRGLPWVQNAIFFSLTAMEMAWFTPLVMIFLPETQEFPPILFLLGLWAVMLGMMIIAHFLEQRDIASPAFEFIVAGVLLLLGLVAVRLFVFGDEPLFSFRWLGELFTLDDKTIRTGVILGTMAFLWWRAVTFLQREINFFIIGYDFRKGVLTLLLTVSIFRFLSGQSAMLFVYVFFFFGLLAVALGRAEEKASTIGDGRSPIQRGWLGVVGLSTLAVIGIAWLFGRIWSLEGFRALWVFLTPALGWLAPYVEAAMLFFLRLLNPLLEWLVNLASGVMGGESGDKLLKDLTKNMPSADKVMGEEEAAYVPSDWVMIFFHYILPITIALIILFLLVFWLVKRRQARKMKFMQEEHIRVESLEGEGLMNALRRGLGKIKELAGMVGQFGLGRGFYTALSIRHLYANLQKLAAERGFPRDPAWTPNDYLPSLTRAFPGQDAALRHLTELYNAAEYGHLPADPAELEKMKEAWQTLQTTPPPPDQPTNRPTDQSTNRPID